MQYSSFKQPTLCEIRISAQELETWSRDLIVTIQLPQKARCAFCMSNTAYTAEYICALIHASTFSSQSQKLVLGTTTSYLSSHLLHLHETFQDIYRTVAHMVTRIVFIVSQVRKFSSCVCMHGSNAQRIESCITLGWGIIEQIQSLLSKLSSTYVV